MPSARTVTVAKLRFLALALSMTTGALSACPKEPASPTPSSEDADASATGTATTATSATLPNDTNTSATSVVTAPPPPPPPPIPFVSACPSSFAEAEKPFRCNIGMVACKYAQGSCDCVGGVNCGGAPMPPPMPGQPGAWRCMGKNLLSLGPDGCPYGAPPTGAKCANEGKVCDYGPCSWNQTASTCTGGKWRTEHHMGPPPP